eukprot:CAMPEP_0180245772 /NCGR_PEP_ID=MMETSP0987-20121128/35184_1 /TAXON_ID=697907 /ORGANISM="non described non described, Strain CCMP2293" /LENGTH=308 /DNA_ID=CAMNT_0022213473 /DNA_START=301 /DNA_END=1229 /DNA_ORIENTATION=+
MHEEGDVTPAGLLNSGGEVLVGEGQGVHINQAPFVSARGLPVRHAVRPAAGGGGRRGCEVAARTEDGAERGGARRVGAGVAASADGGRGGDSRERRREEGRGGVCRASRMLFGTDRPLRMPVSGRECRLVCCITGLLIDLSNGIAGSMCSKVRVSERSCANDTPLSALDDVSVPVSVLSAVFENLSRGGAATRKDGAAPAAIHPAAGCQAPPAPCGYAPPAACSASSPAESSKTGDTAICWGCDRRPGKRAPMPGACRHWAAPGRCGCGAHPATQIRPGDQRLNATCTTGQVQVVESSHPGAPALNRG